MLHMYPNMTKEEESNSQSQSSAEAGAQNAFKAAEQSAFLNKIAMDKIADYEHWSVYLDIKQYYLGRVFIWARRPDANIVTDLSDSEFLEIKAIWQDLKKMYAENFSPDTLNFAFLGNDVAHCHCHVVPRYKEPREVAGIIFKDENWGHNYSNDNTKSFKVSEEIRDHIKKILKESLAQVLSQTTNRTTLK